MFGSTPNPFGQTSNSPFGSPSGFGQTSNSSNNNPFAPKPFGSTAPFGASQTGASLFGGTSTGVFGTATQSPSPFGASSSPAFGSSTPAFGASSSTPAFGASSSPFGGSSVFGQKPAFGAFGSSTPTQPSPFGSTAQASQPAFGNSLFGSSTPLGGSSQPAFGATSTPAFGAPQSASAFGAPQSASAFGSTTTQPGSLFGSGGGFGTSSAPAFGSSATSAFGAQSASAFGASSAPAFSFGSSPAFGQTASAFGSTPFPSSTTNPSPFGGQSSVFGAQTTTPAFGNNTGFGQQPTFGGAQRGGSRAASYAATIEPDSNTAGATAKLVSISAMPIYKDKSHEELRWEDYQLGDKGGPMPAAQAPGMNFNSPASQPSVLSGTSPFGQTTPNPFSNQTSSNIFAPKTSTPTSTFNATGFMPASSSSPSLFNPSSAPSLFSSVSAPFSNTSSSLFTASSSSFTTPSFSPQVPGSAPSLFSNVTPSQPGVSFAPSTATFGPVPTPSFTNSLFNSPSTGFANNFSSTSSLTSNPLNFNQTTPSFTGFTSASQPAQQTNNAYPMFSNSQPANSGALATGMFANMSATQNPAVVQPVPATNPFGTLPAMPQMSIGRGGTTPSVQYGISSMPASDKAAPVRISSFLTSRHLSQRRIRLPARKYNPKTDGAKVPFFSDDDNTDSTPKADALFLPRENPRALVIRPADHYPSKPSADKPSPLKGSSPINENGKSYGEAHPAVNGFHSEDKTNGELGDEAIAQEKQKADSVKTNQKANGVHDEQHKEDSSSYKTLSGHRAGEAAIVYEHGAGIEALMPKLRRSDYYTEPRIQELAAKERADPGFCCRVKDFTVGRHGFGSIKFFGETDVRRLDLESLVQFNNREVIVYMDDTKKPPVGQGLNKPAEVTLLNIKCFDKKTGRHITEGLKIDKYTEMLKRKAKDQGAEFVSYAPTNGEWKFRVDHFSGYGLTDEDDEDAFN